MSIFSTKYHRAPRYGIVLAKRTSLFLSFLREDSYSIFYQEFLTKNSPSAIFAEGELSIARSRFYLAVILYTIHNRNIRS